MYTNINKKSIQAIFFFFFVAFYLSVFVLFIVSAFKKRGRGSEIDTICICSHICGGLTHLLDVSQAILTPVESQ